MPPEGKEKMPPLHRIAQGYQVLWTSDCSWLNRDGKQCWMPVMNSYGYPYTLRGFAINRARNMAHWHKNSNAYSYVLDQVSGKIVWKSWESNNG